jgi:hypothetical protein
MTVTMAADSPAASDPRPPPPHSPAVEPQAELQAEQQEHPRCCASLVAAARAGHSSCVSALLSSGATVDNQQQLAAPADTWCRWEHADSRWPALSPAQQQYRRLVAVHRWVGEYGGALQCGSGLPAVRIALAAWRALPPPAPARPAPDAMAAVAAVPVATAHGPPDTCTVLRCALAEPPL